MLTIAAHMMDYKIWMLRRKLRTWWRESIKFIKRLKINNNRIAIVSHKHSFKTKLFYKRSIKDKFNDYSHDLKLKENFNN